MKQKSPMQYILEGLIPYTRANMLLAFKPSAFFRELEKLDRSQSHSSYRSAYYRAIKRGLVELDDQGNPRLTQKGKRKIQPFVARKLKGAQLVVIFDIAEVDRWKRSHLRLLLKELSFKQIQKSVWASEYDHVELMKMEIEELGLGNSLQLFEAKRIK